jgi:methylated-DNA-[protein]-cysteine S-methyltransferase
MESAGIYARESEFLERYVQIGVAQGRLISLSFPHEADAGAGSEHDLLDRIEAYLDGTEDDFFDVAVALTLPTDRRDVLEGLRKVPYGERISIPRLARLAGLDDEDESDVELVESALRENSVPLVIPDHRVEGPGATPDEVARRLRALEE